MAEHNRLGVWGENLAREYLIANGYAIVNLNMRVGHKEVDLVAQKGSRIIFVEVKTRSTDFVDPLEAVDDKKIRRMVRVADAYVSQLVHPFEPQFDIITIVGTPETGHRLTHYPDAFMPPLSGAR
ncbi:MAG: YraN family protein [Paramuribaculum sp.]|nr:YraN family protein [Paramuribaculum sp.]